jgi:filamentous hemagglutinin family protein
MNTIFKTPSRLTNFKGRYSKIYLATMLSLGAMSVVHANEIVVDVNAPQQQQAGISSYQHYPMDIDSEYNPGETDNSVERMMINIQTPNIHGLSYNKYTQFDVSGEGIALNNRPGNPHIVNNRVAKVILNEVNSSVPSQLNGEINVLGDRAHVIFANPAGINCNGCKFTHANQITLTTGLPVAWDGSRRATEVSSLDVSRGNIVIGKGGLWANEGYWSKQQLKLLATSIKIDGTVQADEIYAIAGNGYHSITDMGDFNIIDKIDRSLSQINNSTDAYGVDISKVGGMYADKIYITSAQKSVRNKGHIQGNNTSILANKLHNQQGKITADDWNGNPFEDFDGTGIEIVANKILNGYGNITTKRGDINIISKDGIINNNGTITAGSRIDLKTYYFSNENGHIESKDVLSIVSSPHFYNLYDDPRNSVINNKNGKIHAGYELELYAKKIDNSSGEVSSSNREIFLTYGNLLNDKGEIFGDNLYITRHIDEDNEDNKYYGGGNLRYTLADHSIKQTRK